MVTINKILAPTDCSEPSSDAIFYAMKISETFKAELIVLKVFAPPVIRKYTEASFSFRDEPLEKTKEHIEEIEAFWNRYVKNGIKPEFVTLIGDPFDEIIRYSKKYSIDIIVMGTHGYTGFKHILMGSVAEKVVRYSSVPVLTVKQKSFEYRQATQ